MKSGYRARDLASEPSAMKSGYRARDLYCASVPVFHVQLWGSRSDWQHSLSFLSVSGSDPARPKVELLLDAKALVAGAPFYDQSRNELLWVDIQVQ